MLNGVVAAVVSVYTYYFPIPWTNIYLRVVLVVLKYIWSYQTRFTTILVANVLPGGPTGPIGPGGPGPNCGPGAPGGPGGPLK